MNELPDLRAELLSKRPRRQRRGSMSIRLTPTGFVLLFVINLAILGLMARLLLQVNRRTIATPVPSSTSLPNSQALVLSATNTPEAATPTEVLIPSPYPVITYTAPLALPGSGILILALNDGYNSHLFAYEPQKLPFTRLTSGPWDDTTPALSPDGKRIAFASNRNGYWDLYLLELSNGSVSRVTDTLEYDAAPTWSPDGLWLAYETYSRDYGGNLEIYIRSVVGDTTPIRLTDHPGADYAPAWSPRGRQIAFVSTRSGQAGIWLADLDKTGDDRYQYVSQNQAGEVAHPAWSPDGASLAWSAVENGFHNLYTWDVSNSDIAALPPQIVGSGDWPVWSQDSKTLVASLLAPNGAYLTAYSLGTPGLVMPLQSLPGSLEGILWMYQEFPNPLADPFIQAAQVTSTPLWLPALTPLPDAPGGRQQVIPLKDVQAPHAYLNDMVDESFKALRGMLASETGWDFLSSLENAYVPLTDSLEPGMGADWLYTGRAIAVTSLPINAGWMVTVREDFGAQTYWRVYLRARYQDGSAGVPLHNLPWDFSARLSGNTDAYEQGGALAKTIPDGYWVDFTQRAIEFGWERLPALSMWRSSYQATRFNEFTLTDGLDWRAAMLELYPPEVLITPTAIVPPSQTPTLTPRWYQTPTPSITPSPRATLTPLPPTPTLVPTETASSLPSSTSTPKPTSTRTVQPRTAIPSSTPSGVGKTPTPKP